ncbi:GspE/PulE family protein [Nitrosomonas sp. Nm132]|uniref:GspE/PulE family protein n=1 Tax=Nitrosomonas sp. Nm132 TaxID=1881053 RepID=UPI00088DFF6B|nr:GspE/PulE family protein [Nitrosomonas sp. Nm132]SDH09291.1 Type II secretory pathway ATPase GspE/PulE or T4P pilus assembly pathway ATPase PilB [Nitrosomonas sp. Nm132]
MQIALEPLSDNFSGVNRQQNFSQKLHEIVNRIQAANNLDEIMLEVSKDICALFNADRLIVYTVSEDKSSIISRVKTGVGLFQDLKRPITEHSIVGFVSLNKKIVNLKDVYDQHELVKVDARLRFLKEGDKRTGYRTRQMLAVPILNAGDNELLGVLQAINHKEDTPFPNMIVEGAGEICQVLAIAFKQRQKQQLLAKSRYDHLIANAVLSASELELAARSAREQGCDLENVLIDEFRISPAQIGEALSSYFRVRYEPYQAERIKPMEVLKHLKRDFAESNHWLPIDDTAEGLVVLTLDPERIKALRVVNQIFPKHDIIYTVCTQREFKATLDLFYGAGKGAVLEDTGNINDMLFNLQEDEEESVIEVDEASAASENELVKLVNKIIVDAYKMGVSDIHIEPYPGKEKTKIRFRKDGTLMPYIEIPASYRNALVTRIKIMCDLDISEKRKPQDGKIKFRKFAPLDIELRVATLPSAGGLEDVVMRILSAGEPIPLEKMNFTSRNLQELKSIISKPYGLFFVCGPTGSGKTTTLHSVLKHLNTPETKIWTAEDPVEITQKGLRQVQVNVKAGLTFAAVMRSFLRADPDIIMVGEMRDKETTSIGIEASLTGHLVFATLHTNSAPESVIRLLDMGMDPFNFSDALLGILAQRLAKRLCKCKKPHIAPREEIRRLLTEYCEELKYIDHFKVSPEAAYQEIESRWLQEYGGEQRQITLYEAVGCDRCNGTGYAGRVALHELLTATDALKKNIQEHARVAEMLVTALNDGMRTLKQDGIDKVLQGITDIHQVRAVCIK